LSKQFRGAALFFIRKIEVVAEQRVAARFAKRTRHGSVCKQVPRHFVGDADLARHSLLASFANGSREKPASAPPSRRRRCSPGRIRLIREAGFRAT
jgi:hypothetical protein